MYIRTYIKKKIIRVKELHGVGYKLINDVFTTNKNIEQKDVVVKRD